MNILRLLSVGGGGDRGRRKKKKKFRDWSSRKFPPKCVPWGKLRAGSNWWGILPAAAGRCGSGLGTPNFPLRETGSGPGVSCQTYFSKQFPSPEAGQTTKGSNETHRLLFTAF